MKKLVMLIIVSSLFSFQAFSEQNRAVGSVAGSDQDGQESSSKSKDTRVVGGTEYKVIGSGNQVNQISQDQTGEASATDGNGASSNTSYIIDVDENGETIVKATGKDGKERIMTVDEAAKEFPEEAREAFAGTCKDCGGKCKDGNCFCLNCNGNCPFCNKDGGKTNGANFELSKVSKNGKEGAALSDEESKFLTQQNHALTQAANPGNNFALNPNFKPAADFAKKLSDLTDLKKNSQSKSSADGASTAKKKSQSTESKTYAATGSGTGGTHYYKPTSGINKGKRVYIK